VSAFTEHDRARPNEEDAPLHYARAGIGHLWFPDPGPQTLEVFRLEGGSWRLVANVAGNVKVRAEPFDAVELDLAGAWAR
jgi:putative restriction endonuclease